MNSKHSLKNDVASLIADMLNTLDEIKRLRAENFSKRDIAIALGISEEDPLLQE